LWGCHEVASIISARVAPLARWIRAKTVAVLLPSRTPPTFSPLGSFGALAFLGALGPFLAGLAGLLAFPLAGAAWGFRGAGVGFVLGLGSWPSLAGVA